ncbi:hypothetical protein PO124_15605 [Bacillus licheniformis]|nr:hypothetical protein [Bacillus licheniformis]
MAVQGKTCGAVSSCCVKASVEINQQMDEGNAQKAEGRFHRLDKQQNFP